MSQLSRHQPAFKGKIVSLINAAPEKVILDLTLGDGTHTQECLNSGAKVISFEYDQESISRTLSFIGDDYTPIIIEPGNNLVQPSDFRWIIVHDNYLNVRQYFRNYNLPLVDGAIADLGISENQLTSPSRGLSFNGNSKLDMRLDGRLGVTAADLLNALSEKDLTELFLSAEETYARAIARKIVSIRRQKLIETTDELSEIVASVKPRTLLNPSTKVFMALRIAVNLEYQNITGMLPQLLEVTNPGAIIAIISFHSGEDRLAKKFIKDEQDRGTISIINKKPIKPDLEEVITNNKVRSAKLRLIKKND